LASGLEITKIRFHSERQDQNLNRSPVARGEAILKTYPSSAVSTRVDDPQASAKPFARATVTEIQREAGP
jgi:hypothetical protein